MNAIRCFLVATLMSPFIVACANGGGLLGMGKKVPVVAPKKAGDDLDRYVREVERVIAPGGSLTRSVTNDQPCGDDTEQLPLGKDPNIDPFDVISSPYSLINFSHLNVGNIDQATSSVTRLRDHLNQSGWEIKEFLESKTRDVVTVRASRPEDGFSINAEGLVTAEGKPRIVFSLSSPCYKHPLAGR